MEDRRKIYNYALEWMEQNIDEGLWWTAMARVFEEGSFPKISNKLMSCFDNHISLHTEEEYYMEHAKFCKWFQRNIKTVGKNGETKRASYGQGAKILDMMMIKYYCRLNLLPCDDVQRVVPWLNCPIDSHIIKDLKKHYKGDIPKVSSIKSINKRKYKKLQKIVRDVVVTQNDIRYPIEYDKKVWIRSKKEGILANKK